MRAGLRGSPGQKYLKKIEECTEARIDIISTGAERDDTIILRHPFE
jgi:adenylosuccinate synthase